MNYSDLSIKQIHIHGSVVNGQLHFDHLPKLREGTPFHLVTELDALVDSTEYAAFQARTTKILLKAGTRICLGLSKFPPEARAKDFTLPGIEAILEGHALLSTKAGKTEKSTGHQVFVPFVDKKFSSINNAYIELSKMFEPKRRSNSYNVYKETWVLQNDREILLDDVRNHVLATPEFYLRDMRPFWIEPPLEGMLLGQPKFATINRNRNSGEVQVLFFEAFGKKVEIQSAKTLESAIGLIKIKGHFEDYASHLHSYGPEVMDLDHQADVMAELVR